MINYPERLVFLGSPSLAAAALKILCEAGFNIVGVVSQPDRIKGRVGAPTPSPVAQMALDLKLPLHRPVKLNKDYGFIADLKPDLLLTFAYGQILAPAVLALSKLAPLNVHASDLPKLRGASPLQSALLNGEKQTAVCLMEMVAQMDSGPVFARQVVEIADEDNLTTLTAKISTVANQLLTDKLPRYFKGELPGEKQDATQATFCHPFKKIDTLLTGMETPKAFVNKVRAFADKPGAFLILDDNTTIKVYRAAIINEDKNHAPGLIEMAQKDTFAIGVKDGCVRLLLVQKEGKKRLDVKTFLNGERHLRGHRLLSREEVLAKQPRKE